MNASKLGSFSFTVVALSASVAAASGPADGGDASANLAPIDDAVELTLGTGMVHGFGDAPSQTPIASDLESPGFSLGTGVGYRLMPELALGIEGQFAMFDEENALDSAHYAGSAGVHVDWHFLPRGHSFDPWASLGVGWRGYWIERDAGTTSLQGIDLAKFRLGVDYRADRYASLGPVVGVDLSTFLWESGPRSDGFQELDEPGLNSFVFVGMAGRLDIATRGARNTQLASR